MNCNWIFVIASVLFISGILLQNVQGEYTNNTLTWCVVSKEEYEKCTNFSSAVTQDRNFFGENYIQLNCTHAFNKEECITLLNQEQAHLTTLDAGEVFTAGRYYSLVPIMKEIYEDRLNFQYAVAVVKKGSVPDVTSLFHLRGKKACFSDVLALAGWVIPLNQLIKHGGMEIVDCNNHVKSAIQYFGPSCAVNSLIDKYNPLGDNSDQLCKLCIGKVPGGKCTNADPYAGYEGAFKCLSEIGDVAFLIHTTVSQMTEKLYEKSVRTKNDYELICLDGSRRPIDDYRFCNWGVVPSRAVVTSSATNHYVRKLYQNFLNKAVQRFSTERSNSTDYFISRSENRDYNFRNNTGFDNNYNYVSTNPSGINNYDNRNDFGNYNNNNNNNNNNYYETHDGANRNEEGRKFNSWDDYRNEDGSKAEGPYLKPEGDFNMFDSQKYSKYNLLFSDLARGLVSIPERDQIFSAYLGNSFNSFMTLRDCPVSGMKLCVTSIPEMEKCEKMKFALDAQLLKPKISCYKGYSQNHCMREIRDGNADVTVLDASDVYTAGLHYKLFPFISEVYNLGSPEYYVVAVAKEDDRDTDLTYLKNKYTCHTGINTAAGWVYPLSYLLTNRWIRGYGCDSIRAAAEYFAKSCIPGALSTEYNIGVPYDNMCDLCHGTSSQYCRRDHSEDYFGYTGAFRCLVEGGGDVAFVKHTTVAENVDGKRKEFWARNTFTRDFQLLCPDGTRRSTHKYKECNLGKVVSNAIVTRGGENYNESQVKAYINLFIYAQQLYGKNYRDDYSFSMFYSAPPYSDLIFQDATQQLVVIPKEKRNFRAYLGPDFMRARRIVDCAAGASSITYSLFGTFTMLIFALISSR